MVAPALRYVKVLLEITNVSVLQLSKGRTAQRWAVCCAQYSEYL